MAKHFVTRNLLVCVVGLFDFACNADLPGSVYPKGLDRSLKGGGESVDGGQTGLLSVLLELGLRRCL